MSRTIAAVVAAAVAAVALTAAPSLTPSAQAATPTQAPTQSAATGLDDYLAGIDVTPAARKLLAQMDDTLTAARENSAGTYRSITRYHVNASEAIAEGARGVMVHRLTEAHDSFANTYLDLTNSGSAINNTYICHRDTHGANTACRVVTNGTWHEFPLGPEGAGMAGLGTWAMSMFAIPDRLSDLRQTYPDPVVTLRRDADTAITETTYPTGDHVISRASVHTTKRGDVVLRTSTTFNDTLMTTRKHVLPPTPITQLPLPKIGDPYTG